MSGVCGYQRRCGDPECPFSVCSGCPIAEALDAAGIDHAKSWGEVREAMDKYGEMMRNG